VPETNEANNQLIVPVTVAPGHVNLVIVANSFSVSPSSIKRFSSATATVTVKNAGTFPVGSFAVQWFPTQSGSPQSKTVSGGLSPGQTMTLTYKATYFQAAGPYTSKIVIDPTNQVPETNESDNTATTPVNITPFK
jgi:subtilase family serine protease